MSTYSIQCRLPIASDSTQSNSPTVAELWTMCTDFGNWPQWLPQALSISILNGAPVGRGTELKFTTNSGAEHWQVSFWDPGKRMVFQINGKADQCACAMELRKTNDDNSELLFEMEFALSGVRRFLRPLLKPMHTRYAHSLANNLQTWLQSSAL